MSWPGMVDDVLERCLEAFGEEVEYRLSLTSPFNPVTIRGVFSSSHIVLDPATNAAIDTQMPGVGIRLADLPRAPREGDRIIIRGQEYRVIESQEDGEGGSLLLLNKV